MNMKNFLSKISNWVKDHQDDIILLIGVILISLLSFAVGFITAKQQESQPLEFKESTYEKNESSYCWSRDLRVISWLEIS